MALPAAVEDGGCCTNLTILGTGARFVRLNAALDAPAAVAATLNAPASEFAVRIGDVAMRLTRYLRSQRPQTSRPVHPQARRK